MKYPLHTQSQPVTGEAAKKLLEAIDSGSTVINDRVLAMAKRIAAHHVQIQEASLGREDDFGQRYTLDFAIVWHNREATLRSGWIIEPGSEIPKLTTCYPL